MEVDDPYTIKKLGEEVKTSEARKRMKNKYFKKVLREKFLQNKTILDKFLSTPHTSFYECTMGSKWGCGSKLNFIDLDPEKLKGINRFGVILNDLKRELTENKNDE